jgi:hypothetical protein
MKKIMPFIVFLCCFSTVLHAQLDTFNLSRYKLPDIRVRQLDLNVNLDGSRTFDKSKTEDNSSKYSTFESNNDLTLGYKSYRNSLHLQSEQSYVLGFNPKFSNSKSDGDILYKNSDFSSTIHINSQNRIYFQHQFFFEPDITVDGYFTSVKHDKRSQLTLVRSGEVITSIQAPLLIGHGRIEQVQDARLAVYILGELQKAGRLSKVPGNEEIIEFSQLISTIKNERFFDYRLKKMEEIEKVDSFLRAKGLITVTDARYFTVVNDNWDYAQGPVRESGKRISAGLVPSFAYLRSDVKTTYSAPEDTSELKVTRNQPGIELQALYEIEKPINLHWQKSMSVKLSYGYSREMNNSRDFEYPGVKSDAHQFRLDAGIKYGMGYFPTSRTDITGVASLDFQQFNRKETLEDPHEQLKGYGLVPDFTVAVRYYISPQCRLNIDYGITYFYTNNNVKDDIDPEFNYLKTNYLTQSFTIGFLYSFF